jgi:hypothetical protein
MTRRGVILDFRAGMDLHLQSWEGIRECQGPDGYEDPGPSFTIKILTEKSEVLTLSTPFT